VSVAGVENGAAQITKIITTAGDITAPAAPASVTISSALKVVKVNVTITRPLPLDFAGVELDLWRAAVGGGTLIQTVRIAAPTDDEKSGSMVISQSFALDGEAYGNVILARARSVDFSNNLSAYTNSGSTTLSKVVTGDVNAGVISNIVTFSNNAQIEIQGTTEVAAVTITTLGRPVLLFGKANLNVNGDGPGTCSLELRRGTLSNGTLIDASGNLDLGPNENDEGVVFDKDVQGAGTYTYKLWAKFTAGGATAAYAGYRKLEAVEMGT
jgi:hypothetical protein